MNELEENGITYQASFIPLEKNKTNTPLEYLILYKQKLLVLFLWRTLISTDFGSESGYRGTEFYICKEIYYENLAYVIMEAEKSHDLPSAKWRSRKASGVIHFKTEGLRTRRIDGVNPNPRSTKDKMKCPSSTMRQEKGDKFLLLLFAVFKPSKDWMSTHIGKGNLLY